VRSYSSGVRHDYKDSSTGTSAINTRSLSWFAVGLVFPLLALVLLLISEPNESMVPSQATPTSSQRVTIALLPPAGERVRLELPPLIKPSATANQLPRPGDLERNALLAQGDALTLTVRSGDTLDQLFRRNNLSIGDLAAMVTLPDAKSNLTKIKPGNRFEIIHDGSRVLSLTRELNESQELWIKRDGEGFTAEMIDLETEVRMTGAHGVIDSSLFEAGADAGISDAVTMEMAGKFQWDIDFNLDVRKGDSFTVVYEEIWRNGVKLKDGDIIAAEYVNRGTSFRAARYLDASGNVDYYTPEGLNVRKAFLRNPIPIVRISSGFNPNRLHPILNTIRAHRGVDYAAPTGTQVFASSDGKVIARGVNGSYGNRIELQHGGNVTTLYAHLSRFGNFRVGSRVKQGDVIGYVGATGGATGPHLHYEYRVNGVHQNPRTVDLPPAAPIAAEYRDDFKASAAKVWHQLDLYQGSLLASNVD
jgi:murein DD-endopeptidase MepM/ murein hydrolase activator NlpD